MRLAGAAPRGAVPDQAGDVLDVLAGVLSGTADPELADVLRRRGLDAALLAGIARPAGTRSAAALLADARERFDTAEPDHAQLLVAAFAGPDPAATAVAAALGAAPRELAYECARLARRRHPGRGAATTASTTLSIVDVLLRVAGGVAVVAGAVSDRAWWRIALVVLFGLGQTGLGPLTRAVPVTVLWLAAGPLPGGFALGSAAATVLLEHTQRWDGFLETGIWLSIRQWRAVQRWTNARYARVMAGLRRGRAGREERHGER